MSKAEYTASKVVFIFSEVSFMISLIGILYYLTQIPSEIIFAIFLLGNINYFILNKIEMKLKEKYANSK